MADHLLRALLLVAVVLACVPAAASAAPTQLGPVPVEEQCRFYVPVEGEQCYYEVRFIEWSMGKHLFRVGDEVSTAVAFDHDGSIYRWAWDSYPAGFTLQNPDDCPSGRQSASKTCVFKATSATGGWRTAGPTLHDDFSVIPSMPFVEGDYYAILGDGEYGIEGTLMGADPADPTKRVPVAGAVVEAVPLGPGTPTPAKTNANGRYTMIVDAGDYAVRVTGASGAFCVKGTEAAACQLSSIETLGPDAVVDFEQVPRHRIHGTMTTEDGQPVEGVTITATAKAGPSTGEVNKAVTDDAGAYELTAPQGLVEVAAKDPDACVKPKPDGGDCPPSKTFDLGGTALVDFLKEGCVGTLTYEGVMEAKGECFRQDPVKTTQHTIEDPFVVNGITIDPTGEVVFDKEFKTMTSVAPAALSLKIPGGAPLSLGLWPGVAVIFDTAGLDLFKVLPGGGQLSLGNTLGGLRLTGKAGLKFAQGSTAFTLEVGFGELGRKNFSWEDAVKGFDVDSQEVHDKESITVTFTTDNAAGVRRLDMTLAPGKKLAIPPNGPSSGSTKYVRLSSLGGSYDWVSNAWALSGKVEAPFLSGIKAGSAVANAFGDLITPPEIEATTEFNGLPLPYPKKVTVNANGLNRHLAYGVFLQRLGASLGADAFTPGSAFEQTFGLGVSLGPKVGELPELVSLDASMKLSDADRNPLTLLDLMLSGDGALAVVGHTFITGRNEFWPGQMSFLTTGKVELKLPFDAFKLSGEATSWIDGLNSQLAAEGEGTLGLLKLGEQGARYAATTEGLGVCVLDRLPSQAEATPLYGITYNWRKGTSELGGCNLDQFTVPKPAAPASAAQAATSFTVPAKAKVFAVAVQGAGGAPGLTVSGPSGRLTVKAGENGRKRWVHAIGGLRGASTTYLVLVKPKPGRYRVTPAKGSRVRSLRTAREAPEAQVTATVRGACRPTVRFRSRGGGRGQVLRFLDMGGATTRVLGTSRARTGTVRVPQPVAGERTIVAEVLQGGVRRERVVLGSYTGPSERPAAPSAVRVARRGKTGVRITWAATCGAQRYRVAVAGLPAAEAIKPQLDLRRLPKAAKTVTITAIGADGRDGGSITRSVGISAGR